MSHRAVIWSIFMVLDGPDQSSGASGRVKLSAGRNPDTIDAVKSAKTQWTVASKMAVSHKKVVFSLSRPTLTIIYYFYATIRDVFWFHIVKLFTVRGSVVLFVPYMFWVLPDDVDMGSWMVFIVLSIMSEKGKNWKSAGRDFRKALKVWVLTIDIKKKNLNLLWPFKL